MSFKITENWLIKLTYLSENFLTKPRNRIIIWMYRYDLQSTYCQKGYKQIITREFVRPLKYKMNSQSREQWFLTFGGQVEVTEILINAKETPQVPSWTHKRFFLSFQRGSWTPWSWYTEDGLQPPATVSQRRNLPHQKPRLINLL